MYIAMGSILLAYVLGLSLMLYNLKNIKENNAKFRAMRKKWK